jgi:hypothetical protein
LIQSPEQTLPSAESSQQAADRTDKETASKKIALAKSFMEGPGEKSTDIPTDHLIVHRLNVTLKLMEHRKGLLETHDKWAESENVSKRLYVRSAL